MKINYLPKEQKKLIRLLCAIQIRSLGSLTDITDTSNTELFESAADVGISRQELMKKMDESLERYLEVHADPRQLLDALSESEIDTLKHIMTKYITHRKYDQVKRSLWQKFRVSENPHVNYLN